MIPISILIVTFVSLLYYFCTRTFSYWRDKKVVGPKPIPFFGNLIESALRRKHVGIVYKEVYDQFPDEKIVGIFRMTNPAIVIRDLDLIKRILVKDFEAFPERGIQFGKDGLGDNLFHCDSEPWRALRRRLTPLFTSGKLKNTISVIDRYADQLINHLEKFTLAKTEYEMHNIFQKYTMASIMAASFRMDVDFFEENQAFIETAGHYIFRSTYAAETDMLFPSIWRQTNISLYPMIVNKFSNEVIQTQIKAMKDRYETTSAKSDLIETLVALKKAQDIEEHDKNTFKLTDHVMAGQVFIFFAAGFGNNALSLAYALFHLAKHQDCQDKLIQEIDEVMGKYNGKLVYEALNEMPYLEKVFLETLRMHTLTNSIQRLAVVDYKIPDTDIVIEKGTTVFISPYGIHRDSKIYPDPDTFDPERFSAENSAGRHSCAYLPFGVGPRSCIGRQLARLQFFAAITKIFSKFRVEPSDKTKVVDDYDPMCTLLATKGGIYVTLVPRKM